MSFCLVFVIIKLYDVYRLLVLELRGKGMKQILCAILVAVSCLGLVACGNADEHIGEARTPSASSAMHGRDYTDVIETFEKRGFTNIKTERIEDLVFGFLVEDGEVEEVSVGGDVDYDVDKWVPADTEVIIYYHTFPADDKDVSNKEGTDNIKAEDTKTPLTVDNCPELEKFVKEGIETPENESAWISFLEAHKEEVVEFDGTITDWYDEAWWSSISFDIAIEDSDCMSFSKSCVGLIELGMTGEYHYKNYHLGLIQEGMRVHVIAQITETGNGWDLELDSMQIIQ